MKNGFAVSICMITYNHESYIKQAIEGVLMQKTNFDFELVIGEDCSTDSTRLICEEYANRETQICLLPSKSNLGVMPNFTRTLKACTGKYIALCEGDDYWTDPFKLQKQVNILEKDNSIGLVHTSCKFWDENMNFFFTTNYAYSNNQNYTFNKLFLKNTISTCTTMFRKHTFDNFESFPQGDLSMWLYIAINSKIVGMEDVTSVYRIANNSLSSWNNPTKRIKFLENWLKIQSFYYTNYDIPAYLIIKKYIEHINDMLKISIKTKSISPLIKGIIFIKKEIIKIMKYKK